MILDPFSPSPSCARARPEAGMIADGAGRWSRSMKDESAHRQPRRSRLVMGIFLLVLGALLLAANLGYHLPWGWWRYLPGLLIAFGLWGLVAPNRHLDRVGGVWMLAAGLYCLCGIFGWWGLGWGSAWPIFVIAAGLGFILHRHDDRPQTSEQGPPRDGVS
jgi:hypothetical protein